MREYSKITPQFWLGSTGKKLRGHPEAQIVALYLLTTPHANMLGLYYLPKMFIAHETGLPFEGASKGLARCIEVGFCHYDDDAESVWVVEMALHQVGELKSTDNRCSGIQNEYDKLPDNLYLQGFYDKYASIFHMKKKRGFVAPSKPLRSQEQEQEQEQEKEQELNNKNNASDEKSEQAIIDSYRKEQDTRRDFELFVDWKPEPKSWDNQLKASKHIVHPSQFTDYSLCEFIRLNIGKPPKNENGWQKYYISAIAKGFIKSAQVDQPSTNQPYQNQQPQRKVCTMAGYTPEGLKNWDLEPMKNPEDFIPASPEFMEKCREAIRNGGAK